jgi:hypothetical protein
MSTKQSPFHHPHFWKIDIIIIIPYYYTLLFTIKKEEEMSERKRHFGTYQVLSLLVDLPVDGPHSTCDIEAFLMKDRDYTLLSSVIYNSGQMRDAILEQHPKLKNLPELPDWKKLKHNQFSSKRGYDIALNQLLAPWIEKVTNEVGEFIELEPARVAIPIAPEEQLDYLLSINPGLAGEGGYAEKLARLKNIFPTITNPVDGTDESADTIAVNLVHRVMTTDRLALQTIDRAKSAPKPKDP